MGEICYSCFAEKSTAGACPRCGYDPASDEGKYPIALRAGSILNGRYIVGRVLGQGGFGITYLAQDYQTKGLVAIKEYLPTEFAGRTTGTCAVQVYSGDRRENFEYGKEQFLAEAKTLAEFIGNDHIVRIYSYFEEYGTAYLAMEYIDGESLDKYMRRFGGRLTVEQANELLIPVMEALDWVHSKGIVHRDIAPDNIIVTKDGRAKLIDFGAARYSTGEKSKSLDVILKHGFAPKEQYIRRGRQGPFTDVYAMAATYYYAITGKILPDAIERMDEDELIPPTTLGVKMNKTAEDALLKGLEVSASERYQRMGELAEGLDAKPVRQVPEQPSARSFDFSRPEAAPAAAKPKPAAQAEERSFSKGRAYEAGRFEGSDSTGAAPAAAPVSETPAEAQKSAPPAAEKSAPPKAGKKKKSKTKGWVLTIISLISLIIYVAAMTDVTDSTSGYGWRYNESTKTLYINYEGPMPNYDRESARPWNGYRYAAENLVISDSVTSIGNSAFSGFSHLKSITMADSVTKIGNYAFSGCTSLTSVEISINVTRICYGAFKDCSKLRDITVSDGVTIETDAFSGTRIDMGNNGITAVAATEPSVIPGKFIESQNVHNGYTCPFKLDSTARNLTGVILNLNITNYTGSFPFGTFYLYAKTENGYWDHIAQFSISKDQVGKYVTYDLKFDGAETFDYLAICAGMGGSEYTYSFDAVYYYYK